MHPDDKIRFRLSLGAAGLGLLACLGCGHEAPPAPKVQTIQPGLVKAEPPAPPQVTEAAPGLPVLRIQAEDMATSGTLGHQATASGDPDLQYEWFIQGGSFEGDARTSMATWTAGAPGEVRLFCRATNPAGKQSVVMTRVSIVEAPDVSRFDANPPVVTAGSPCRLGWSASGIKTLQLDPGAHEVGTLKGPGYEVKPTATTTYTLTATNPAGVTAKREVTVRVVPPPLIQAFRANGAVGYDLPLALVAEFSGGHAEIRSGSELLASSDNSPLTATLPKLEGGASFTLTVTNEAKSSASRVLNFNAQAPEAKAPEASSAQAPAKP